MVIFVVVFVWLSAQWSIGYFGSTKASGILTASVVKNREVTDDAEMKALLLTDLKAQGPIHAGPDDLLIFRSQDGLTIQIKLKYVHSAGVPLTSFEIPFKFDVEINESLKKSGLL